MHRNQQSSIIALTNGSGAVGERYAYTAYGTPTVTTAAGTPIANQASAIANRYSYTGREWDSTIGLYHYRARMYDSGAGRFCSRDPIRYLGLSANLLAYCHSAPVSHVDPTGLLMQIPSDPPVPGGRPMDEEMPKTDIDDAAEELREDWEEHFDNFKEDCKKLWEKIKPFKPKPKLNPNPNPNPGPQPRPPYKPIDIDIDVDPRPHDWKKPFGPWKFPFKIEIYPFPPRAQRPPLK